MTSPSLDRCASTATRRNDVDAAFERVFLRLESFFGGSGGASCRKALLAVKWFLGILRPRAACEARYDCPGSLWLDSWCRGESRAAVSVVRLLLQIAPNAIHVAALCDMVDSSRIYVQDDRVYTSKNIEYCNNLQVYVIWSNTAPAVQSPRIQSSLASTSQLQLDITSRRGITTIPAIALPLLAHRRTIIALPPPPTSPRCLQHVCGPSGSSLRTRTGRCAPPTTPARVRRCHSAWRRGG